MIALLILALAFGEGMPCRIQGDLYTNPDDTPAFTRTDGCRFVLDSLSDSTLILSSEHFRVEVHLPLQGGHQAFWYVWGSPPAHLCGQDWPLTWTRLVRG